MGGLSIWHWIIVGGVVFILFGGKFKISDVMGDVAKGIKAFKKGMAEDDDVKPSEPPPRAIEAEKPADHKQV
jgi:sec-independent protein translocase protein TatA